VQREEDARAFMIARQLIDQHGDGVAQFLETKIATLMEGDDLEQLSAWFIIRNAVAITLRSDSSSLQ
jgi:hypothetical protein